MAVAGCTLVRLASSPAGNAWPSASAASIAARVGSPNSAATGARARSREPGDDSATFTHVPSLAQARFAQRQSVTALASV